MDRDTSLDVAVVGMDARFSDCVGLDDWSLALRAGQVLTRRYSRQELRLAGVPPSQLDDPGYVPVYGHLEHVLRFDRTAFGISRYEAELIDPQHRMMLETAWNALEDAGVPPRGSDGRIGVFASSTGSTYLRAVLRQGDVDPARMDDLIHGTEPDFAASRISYKLALRGAALSVQNACSSSLVAVHLAVQALVNGDCDRVVVVASGLTFPQAGYVHQTGGVLSASGHCRPFDARADGVVPGAGVVAVVLQLASAVPADAPTPHGVILATAVNNDGADKTGYYAPSVPGQREAIATAWQVARVDIANAAYLEAHGTGTALGDPIEWEAASQAFHQLGARPGQIPVGAVKANIGHLDAASGLAGLVKTLLVLRDRVIPPLAGFNAANPLLHIDGSPLRIATGGEAIAAGGVAGVSSFGIGGTNAHAVLGAWPGWRMPATPDGAERSHGLALSAADGPALARGAAALADWLDGEAADLAATADALTRGRTALAHRVVVRARTRAAARDGLRRVDTASGTDSRRRTEVALLFPGQGTHYPGMARVLSAELPGFDGHLSAVLAHLPGAARAEAEQALWDPTFQSDELRQTRLTQPVLFCAQYAAATALRDLGLAPVAVVGHSLGEIVAVTYGGGLTVPEAVDLVLARATAMQACAPGRMLSVALPEVDVVAMLDGTDLDLAAVNSPTHCVVAGAPGDVERLADSLRGAVRIRLLDADRAFHSRLVRPALDGIAAVAAGPSRPLHVTLVSTVTGRIVGPGRTLPPGHFVDGARQPVRFADAVRALVDDRPGVTVVEVGPGRSLSALVELAGAHTLPLHQAHTADGVAGTLDALWTMGAIDRFPVTRTTGRRPRPPTYPFAGEEYSLLGTGTGTGTGAPGAGADPGETVARSPVRGGPVDAVVRACWQETLGVAPDGDAADYFDLGGDSLSMTRLLRRLEHGLGARLPLPELMARPTLRAHVEIAARAVQ